MNTIAQGEAAVPGVATGRAVPFDNISEGAGSRLIALVDRSLGLDEARRLSGYAAVVCQSTTKYSHVVKMLAQLGIPTVINVDIHRITPSYEITVDGWSGLIYAGQWSPSRHYQTCLGKQVRALDIKIRASIANPLDISRHRDYSISRYHPSQRESASRSQGDVLSEDALFDAIKDRVVSVPGEIWWRIECSTPTRWTGSEDYASYDWYSTLPEDQHGALRLVQRLVTSGVQNVMLHLPQVDHPSVISSFRTFLQTNYAQLSVVRLGAMIESMRSLRSVEPIVRAGATYLALGTADFLADTLSLDRENGEHSRAFSLHAQSVAESLRQLRDVAERLSVPLSVGLFDFQNMDTDIETLASLGIKDYFTPVSFLIDGGPQTNISSGY